MRSTAQRRTTRRSSVFAVTTTDHLNIESFPALGVDVDVRQWPLRAGLNLSTQGPISAMVWVNAELRSEGEKLLVQPEIMALAEGLACVPEVRIGAAAEVIAAYAAEQGRDAIVMGTRGMGAVAGLAMGSVAQKVVHLASVPVTLVK